MTTWQAFSYLALHSLEIASYYWEVSLLVACGTAVVIVVGAWTSDTKRRVWLALLPYAAPILMVALGAVLRYDGPPHPHWVEPPAWRGLTLWVVLAANIAGVVAVAVFARGARILATGVAIPSTWITLSSGFIAAIAIGGVGP